MLIEFHFIQNHAPSNLNRDDTGSPKEATFGGVLRARISSQSLKRSIRRSHLFTEAFQNKLGTRTRRLPMEIEKALLQRGLNADQAALVARKVTRLGSDKEGDEGETRQLIFLDAKEVELVADDLKRLFDEVGEKRFADLKAEDLEKAIGSRSPRSVDIALFGRFTTTSAFQDVEASLQVAHAISTSKVDKQFDYFTAVDDLVQSSDEIGAGMIGDIEFNSATFYKYFAIHWDELVKNLGGDVDTARCVVSAFLKAAALTSPSGKQNSFAAHNPPDTILVEVKAQNIPTSYANAFLKPVRPAIDKDIVELSIERLSSYAARLKSAYSLEPVLSAYLSLRDQGIERSQAASNLNELVGLLEGQLSAAGEAGEQS